MTDFRAGTRCRDLRRCEAGVANRRCLSDVIIISAAAKSWFDALHFFTAYLHFNIIPRKSKPLTVDADSIASWFLLACLDVRAGTLESGSVIRHLCPSCTHAAKRGRFGIMGISATLAGRIVQWYCCHLNHSGNYIYHPM
jgi:hypothetical protein